MTLQRVVILRFKIELGIRKIVREKNSTTNRNQSKENKTGYSVKSNELNIIIYKMIVRTKSTNLEIVEK